MMILLLVLSLGLLAAGSTPQDELAIVWKTCADDSKCFCSDSNANNPLKDVPKNTDCASKTGLKVKFLTGSIALFQLQVHEGLTTKYVKGSRAELTLYLQDGQTERRLAGCSGKDEEYTLDAKDVEADNNDIKLFEQIHFANGILYCAFTIGVGFDYIKYIEKQNKQLHRNGFVNMRFTLDNVTQIEYDTKAKISAVVDQTSIRCDPYSFKDLAKLDNYIVKPVIKRDKEELGCSRHGDSFEMRYGNTPEEGETIKKLKCELDTPTQTYVYRAYKEGAVNPEGKIINESTYVYCAAPLDETCTNPFPPRDENCPNCPIYTPGKAKQAAKVTCPGMKWLINGEYLVLSDEPTCKEKPGQSNTARFFTRYPSTYDVSFNEDESGAERCFTHYDCKKASKLDYPGSCQNCQDEIDYSNGTMACRAKDKWLRVVDPILNKTTTPNTVRCDKNTGKWIDDTGAALSDSSQVRCIGEVAKANQVVSIPQPVLIGVIGGLIGGGILMSLAILGGIFCFYRIKANKENNVKNGVWKSMDAKEQLEHAKMVFGQASQSTMDSKGRIFHGLRLLSVLLDTETVDPAIWNETYDFLVRIQWTLEKTDFGVGQMLARYLYLEAAKIIGKHGWLAPSPIMSRTDKGLMRAVAVRLLSLALHSAHSAKDTKRLLEDGFRQLGFNCVEQYPHCGLLWSVMMHCRIYRRNEFKTVTFDRRALVKYLRQAPQLSEFELPKEREIPEFDTPISQAHEAIGASANANCLYETRDTIVNDGKSATYAMKYLAGMGLSLYRNPSHTIFNVFQVWKSPNEKYTERMYKLAEMTKWIPLFDNIMKLMVHYGRPLDAKKFQTRFTPQVPQPSDLYNQLTIDQTFFEEAVETQLEELREWLADRTDLKELKKKPSYNIDPTLDNRLNKGANAAAEEMDKKASAAVAPVNPDATLENGDGSSSSAATPDKAETQPLLPEADALDPDDKTPAAATAATAKAATPAPSVKK